MDLKESLRRDRAPGKGQESFPRSLFAHLGGLVRRHRLGEEFCRLLPHLAPARAETLARTHAAGTKAPYEPPLFFLATPEEYRVIREIMAATENPYLAWAQSPEEILLSRPLYAKHPQLSPEVLAGRHFAALFLLSFEEGG